MGRSPRGGQQALRRYALYHQLIHVERLGWSCLLVVEVILGIVPASAKVSADDTTLPVLNPGWPPPGIAPARSWLRCDPHVKVGATFDLPAVVTLANAFCSSRFHRTIGRYR
jgi:hypothetical protein